MIESIDKVIAINTVCSFFGPPCILNTNIQLTRYLCYVILFTVETRICRYKRFPSQYAYKMISAVVNRSHWL